MRCKRYYKIIIFKNSSLKSELRGWDGMGWLGKEKMRGDLKSLVRIVEGMGRERKEKIRGD